MAATLSTDQFLDVLRKSRLVDEKRLDAFLRASSPTLPTNCKELAQQLVKVGMLTPWQASQILAGKWKGYLLAQGKYKLMERLGAGGMGQVFLCEHVRMKRLVALKVLPMDKLKDDQTALERFDREARASAALDHPNIVRAHDIDTDPDKGLHFLVMEFVDGSSLQDIIKKHGPLDVIRAAHYIADAARGLQHAHEAGWVHRDIKPGNLLLDRTGTVKILDMGLARLFADDSDNLTKRFEKNAVLGTADYLAPEQATSSSDVDIRADIYSLGATFYYLLTGRPPFEDGTVTQKLIWHQQKPPKPVRELRPDVPKEMEAVINKMMAKKPVHRFQEPDAITSALEPWTGQPIEPPADEEMPRPCAALAGYSPAGSSVPLSGMANSSIGIRRGRNGPRSSSVSRKSLPPTRLGGLLGRLSDKHKRWLVIGGGAVGVIAVIWILIAAFSGGPPKTQPSASNTKASQKARTTPSTTVAGAKSTERTNPPPIVPDPGTNPTAAGEQLIVAAGRPGAFATLGEALAKAAPGQTIQVQIPEIAEQLTIDAQHAGVHIESGLPTPVVWRPPASALGDLPLLKFDGAGAARIKGFEFDGGNRVNTLIQVTGNSAGLRLDDLYLTDAQKVAVMLQSVASTVEQPVTLERVRITSVRDYALPDVQKLPTSVRSAAVRAKAISGSQPFGLAVKWCRFEGVFLEAIHLDQCAIDATLELNRFYTQKHDDRPVKGGIVNAVSVHLPASGAVRVKLDANTEAWFTHFLRVDKLPPADSGTKFVLRDNLALGSGADGWVWMNTQPAMDAAKPFFAGSGGNVCRPGTMMKGQTPAVVPRKFIAFGDFDMTLSTDGFLRYRRTGDSEPLMKAGADDGPVGVPPQ
jgi:serine/threonine protein kinase